MPACGGEGDSPPQVVSSPPPVNSPLPPAPTSNAIAQENERVGATGSKLIFPAMNLEMEGYASASSVNYGEPIRLYVNTTAPSYTIEMFRLSWSGELGGRRVIGPIQVDGTAGNQPPGAEILCTSFAAEIRNPRNQKDERATSHMTLYTWPSGAQVFATGTMQWS